MVGFSARQQQVDGMGVNLLLRSVEVDEHDVGTHRFVLLEGSSKV